MLVGAATSVAWAAPPRIPAIYQAPKNMIPGYMNGQPLQGNLPYMKLNEEVFEPNWSFEVGLVYLSRNKPQNGAGLLALDATTSARRLHVDEFSPAWEPGAYVGVSRNFHNGWDLKYRYFGIDDWDASAGATDPANLTSPLLTIGAPYDSIDARFTNRLFSHELYATYSDWCSWVRPIVGVQWLELHEDARLEATGGASGVVDFSTRNYLYGATSGLEISLWPQAASWFELNGVMKFALAGSRIKASTDASGGLGPKTFSAESEHLSLIADAALDGRIRFGDHFALFGGYEIVYVAGVAEAWDVYTAADPGKQMTKGCPFYHGGNIGLEFRW